MATIIPVDTKKYQESINENTKKQLITDEQPVCGKIMSLDFKTKFDKANVDKANDGATERNITSRTFKKKPDKDEKYKNFFDYERGTYVTPTSDEKNSDSSKKPKKSIYVNSDIWGEIFSFVNINYNIFSNERGLSIYELSCVCKTFFANLILSLTRYPHKEIINECIWSKHRSGEWNGHSFTHIKQPLNEYLKKQLIKIFSYSNEFSYFINLYTPNAQLSTFNIIALTNRLYYRSSNDSHNYTRQIVGFLQKQNKKFHNTRLLTIDGSDLGLYNTYAIINETFLNLKTLILKKTFLPEENINKTQQNLFKKLEVLKLKDLSQKNIITILNMKMTQLKHLYIKGGSGSANIQDKNEINLMAENINEESSKKLSKLHISINYDANPKPLNIDKIIHILKNLTYLCLGKCSIQIAENQHFELTNLKHLIINRSNKDKGTNIEYYLPYNIYSKKKREHKIALINAPNLETLVIRSSKITRLPKYPKLKTLCLCNINYDKKINTEFFDNLKSITEISLQSLCCYPNQNNLLIFTPYYDSIQHQINLSFYTQIINGCRINKIKKLNVNLGHGMRDQKCVLGKLTFPTEEDYYDKYKETEDFENFIKQKFTDNSSKELKIETLYKKVMTDIQNEFNQFEDEYEQRLYYTNMTL